MSGSNVRVGSDIECIADVANSIEYFGSHYVDRLFTHHEVRFCANAGDGAAAGLAARFAAKEAFFKVLRTADLIPPWKSVEVVRDAGGWTELHLVGPAAAMADACGITQTAVSLSHTAEFALATVIAVVPEPFCVVPTLDLPRSEGSKNMDELIRRVLVAHARMKTDPFTIADTGDLYRAGLTSHASVNVMLAIEDEFGLEFPDDLLSRSTFASIASIASAVDTLREREQ
jgi:phosphopantetheine--protein transferase-like protein